VQIDPKGIQAMRIDHIHLKNYRCFDSLPVALHPQMTVLVAPNGQGKTSILDAIKVALWPYVAGFDLGSTTNDVTSIQIDDVRREQVRTHEMDWRLPAKIEATGQLQVRQLVPDETLRNPVPEPEDSALDIAVVFHEDVLWQCVRYRESVKKGTKTKNRVPVKALDLGETAQVLEQRIFSGEQTTPDDLPMLGYYGTGRLWAQKKLTAAQEKADSETSSRTFAYRDCLDPASSYKHFAQWYTRIFKSFRAAQIRNIEKRLSLDADVPHGFIAPIRAVQLATDAILGHHTGWRELEYSEEHEDLVLNHEQHGQLKVSQLSDGIRNMLALVGDIAYRCYKLNAHMGEAAPRRTHGIVMIDEVDMHLHPSWQQTILTDLTAAFPKLQFIVTTHSPQVLTTVPRESIRVIECDESGSRARMPDFSPLAHESGDALAKIMGTHREPPLPLQERIREFEQLVRAGMENSSDARQLRAELDEAGYQIHESDLTTWRFLAARNEGKRN
jgi:predicted ATP-binding protein involved in virulence